MSLDHLPALDHAIASAYSGALDDLIAEHMHDALIAELIARTAAWREEYNNAN